MASKPIKTVISTACSLALALTAAVPLLGSAPVSKAAAAKTSGGGYFYDLRDGSVIPTTTDGKSDLTVDTLTVKVGDKNAYKYNGPDHGVAFKEGNSLEIKVDGPTVLTIGDCQYNNPTTLTVKDADGSYTETVDIKKGCYHNDGSAAVFRYAEEGATTLTVNFEKGSTYVPIIGVEPMYKDDVNGAVKDSIKIYASDSVITDANGESNPLNGTATSEDGMVSFTSKGGMFFHNLQHGIDVKNRDIIEVKVAGNATVKFNLCIYSADKSAKLIATAPKGKFVGESTQPILKGTALDGLDNASFRYEGPATTLKFIVSSENAGYSYIHSIEVANDPADANAAVGNGKIDVWDFGAEQLDASKYNNMLTEDIINAFPHFGTPNDKKAGVTFGTFMIGDDMFFNGGGKTNNRLRSTNANLIRYDDKSLTMGDTTYTGYLYSNTGSAAVYSGHKLYPGDILRVVVSSNGGDSTIYCESPSGKIQQAQSNSKGVELTFYASEYGVYKLYSANGEKLTLFRAYREHTNPVTVSGKIDTTAASDITSKGYKLVFTNQSSGVETEASISGDGYTASLNDSYTYDVSLKNANGYIIKDNTALTLAKGAAATTKDIAIEKVPTVQITGKITGLSSDALAKLKLTFSNKDKPYVPEYTIDGDSITMLLESGVTYDIVADGVNDYYLPTATISKTAAGSQDIAFAAKPVYDVKVSYNGLSEEAQKAAVLTFTNINENGYVYTFKSGETPKLRDGVYTVKVTGTGAYPYAQKLTSNVKVEGKAVDKAIPFEKLETWDFSKYNAGNPGIETIGDKPVYLGLELNANVAENKTYLLVNKDGEVKFSAKKGQMIALEYCYQAAFDINGDQILSSSGSTSKMESISFIAPEDTDILIKGIEGTTEDGKAAKQTYFTKISVYDPVAYKKQITVGANKEYKTINDALDAVAKMARPNNERVEIVIDPGNYEEMLVVDLPNVTLKNAAGKDSSLSIINKGVDIDNNVVRITSYYGHGYNYYSMNNGCKWDEEVLAANKENGYISKVNPGSGKTDGSYWNSTVVVTGTGFEADGIVFENSFNQYISKKEAADTVVMWESGSKGERPTTYGDTSVQKRSFVERAGAIAILGDKAVFNNCKFIGRQDTLYGDTGVNALFQKCDILGAVDYIYGPMTAVFYQCQLRMNTDSTTDSDQAYLTAAQQTSGRGYLMYNCTVTTTIPGVDTASEYRAKPGYFGRPWAANTSEVVFYNTVVETTDHPGSEGKSLIVPQGWNNTLSGESPKMCEYNTTEKSGENNGSARASWTTMLTEPKLADGSDITPKTFLGDWTKELNARGLALELDKDNKPIDANPGTGIPAEAAAAASAAAVAAAALFLGKKRRK